MRGRGVGAAGSNGALWPRFLAGWQNKRAAQLSEKHSAAKRSIIA